MGPSVGDALRPCPACDAWEYAGAPGCARCAALVDALVGQGWRDFVARDFGTLPPAEQADLARMVAQEPQRHDWRVFDAALDLLTCVECGGKLGGGPPACAACEVAHGYRYAAVETDRPGVPAGNEHAIRVNVSVVRRPQGISAPELLARRLLLPMLLVGHLPTTAQAQRFSAAFKAAAARVGPAALAADPAALATDPEFAAVLADSDFPQLFGPGPPRRRGEPGRCVPVCAASGPDRT